MFARFDENPAMTLRVIKETKRYGRTDGRTHGQRENSIPPTNKVCGGYNENSIPPTNKVCGGYNYVLQLRSYTSYLVKLPFCCVLAEPGIA